MKSARPTKTPSYVTKSRTDNRRWGQQGVGEKDGHRRGDARSGRGVRSHPPNHSAFSSHTSPSRPHYTTADRIHCLTQSSVGSHRPEACGVVVIRTNCPSISSPLLGQDLSVSASASPRLQRQRSSEEIRASRPEKLDQIFFPPFLRCSSYFWGRLRRVEAESGRRRKQRGREQSDLRGSPGDLQLWRKWMKGRFCAPYDGSTSRLREVQVSNVTDMFRLCHQLQQQMNQSNNSNESKLTTLSSDFRCRSVSRGKMYTKRLV